MSVAISTVTWIRTPEERRTVLETILQLSKLDLPIVVVDGQSSTQDEIGLESFPHVHFFYKNGTFTERLLVAQQEAAKLGDAIFYIQSDKLDMAKHAVKGLIDQYEDLPEKGMLVPSRTKKTFALYPPYQQQMEIFLNYVLSEYVGVEADYYVGPKIYPATLVPYLSQMKGDVGWGIEAFLYVLAKRLNLPFVFPELEMIPPKDVGSAEEVMMQRVKCVEQQIDGLVQAHALKL